MRSFSWLSSFMVLKFRLFCILMLLVISFFGSTIVSWIVFIAHCWWMDLKSSSMIVPTTDYSFVACSLITTSLASSFDPSWRLIIVSTFRNLWLIKFLSNKVGSSYRILICSSMLFQIISFTLLSSTSDSIDSKSSSMTLWGYWTKLSCFCVYWRISWVYIKKSVFQISGFWMKLIKSTLW